MIKMLVVVILIFWAPSAAICVHAWVTDKTWLAEMGGFAAFLISTFALACFALGYLMLG